MGLGCVCGQPGRKVWAQRLHRGAQQGGGGLYGDHGSSSWCAGRVPTSGWVLGGGIPQHLAAGPPPMVPMVCCACPSCVRMPHRHTQLCAHTTQAQRPCLHSNTGKSHPRARTQCRRAPSSLLQEAWCVDLGAPACIGWGSLCQARLVCKAGSCSSCMSLSWFQWRRKGSSVFFRRGRSGAGLGAAVYAAAVVWCFLDGVLTLACWWGQGQLLHALGATSTATSSCSAWSSPCGSGQNRAEWCWMPRQLHTGQRPLLWLLVFVRDSGAFHALMAPLVHATAPLPAAHWLSGCRLPLGRRMRPRAVRQVPHGQRNSPSETHCALIHLVMRLSAALNIASRQQRVSKALPHLASMAGGVAVWHAVMHVGCVWVCA